MANIINELGSKCIQWENCIELYRQEYKDAQAEIMSISKQISVESRNSDEFSNDALASLERQKSYAERKMSKAYLEIAKVSAEISLGISQIDDSISKIDKAAAGIIGLGTVNKYGKMGVGSSAVKAEIQNMKTALQQLSQLKAKLTELSYKCDLAGGESDKPKVKSIWQETNPYKK